MLISNNINFEKEKTFPNCQYPVTQGLCRFDFNLPDYNIIIEYDGEQHYVGWGKNYRELEDIQERDAYKTQWCQDNNIPLIRIPYTDYTKLTAEYLLDLI